MTFATDFAITEIVIESTNGQEIDIINQMAEINVYEDFHNACISADIVVDDALNDIKNIPITGHEYIRFSFGSPNKPLISLRLRIYKISNRQLEKMHRQVYIVHCIDNTELLNGRTRVSQSYQGLISDIAKNIQDNYLDSSFNFLEPTKNTHHIIVPYWTPIKAINFLASRANSTQYSGANYVYYQTVDGFNFTSIEKLCDVLPIQNYLFQPANLRKQDVADGYKPRTIKVDEIAIQSYKFENNFDTLENLTNGMYSSRLIWHDIRKKEFGVQDFDYPTTYDGFKHVELNVVPGGSSYLWTSQSDFNDDVFGSLRFMPKANYVTSWLQQRLSQMQQLQNVRLFVTIPGDSTRRVGDLVSITLPSPEAPVNDQLQIDSYFTNRYLVSGLRHMVNRKQYVTILELVKDSVFQAYP